MSTFVTGIAAPVSSMLKLRLIDVGQLMADGSSLTRR